MSVNGFTFMYVYICACVLHVYGQHVMLSTHSQAKGKPT